MLVSEALQGHLAFRLAKLLKLGFILRRPALSRMGHEVVNDCTNRSDLNSGPEGVHGAAVLPRKDQILHSQRESS